MVIQLTIVCLPSPFRIKNMKKYLSTAFIFLSLLWQTKAAETPKTCFDIQNSTNWSSSPSNPSGTVSTIYPFGPEGPSINVMCDFETDGGGWTVIQQRNSGPREQFAKNWTDYENGFGMAGENYWIGLETIRALTVAERQELRFDLEDWDGNTAVAKYSIFVVADASEFYKLTVGGYSGTAEDAFSWHNNLPFSTPDNDNDGNPYNCAEDYESGWWFGYSCHFVNLNGIYFEGNETVLFNNGLIWTYWTGPFYSLRVTSMKIRNR